MSKILCFCLFCGIFLFPSLAVGEETTSISSKGKVRYGDKLVSLDALFKDYQFSRIELQNVNVKLTEARVKLMECQKRLSQLKTDVDTVARPTRADLARAKNKQREYKKMLDAKAPTKPTLQQLPPQPRQSNIRNRSSGRYSVTGGYDNNDSAQQQYDQAMRNWENQCDVIKRQNDTLTQKYNQDLLEYKKNQAEANKELPKVEILIKTCEDKLVVFTKDLESKLTPMLEEVKKDNEEVLGIQAQFIAIETRVKNMVDVIRNVPDEIRFQYNIIEWEGLFYSRVELEKIYTDTQKEINDVCEKLKSEAEKSGQSLPKDWKHPSQERMDVLKILLDKIKVAQK